MSDRNKPTVTRSGDVSAFLEKVARTPVNTDSTETGRLIFAMDATASREPAWDRACHLQGQMFDAVSSSNTLSVQLCYYRGFNEFRHSPWCHHAAELLVEMTGVRCLGGHTQIKRVLEHARQENQKKRVRAVVFVGDAVEEAPDTLCHLAGELGVLGVPLFMFQEGSNASVQSTFRQMASLSGGAYAPFNLNSANELKDLLAAVAVFATGGRKALVQFESRVKSVARLTHQIK